jgi:hypothetical protein
MHKIPNISCNTFQTGDILLTRGPRKNLLAGTIGAGESWEYYTEHHNVFRGVYEAIDNADEDDIPSHSLMVFDPVAGTGAEMTWPKPRYVNLNDYSLDPCKNHIVAAFRCPWLRYDVLAEEYREYLTDKITLWWATFISQGPRYGIENLLSFLLNTPVNRSHPVCSMATTLCVWHCIEAEGYKCKMPMEWFFKNRDGDTSVDKISPLDQMIEFNRLGWGIPIAKYTKEKV